MEGENVTMIEAIVKSECGAGRFRSEVDGVVLWSDGHIAVRGDYPGKEFPELAKKWETNANRAGESLAFVGICVTGFRGMIYRRLWVENGPDVWINEAYRQALQSADVQIFITQAKAPITFRDSSGVMTGMAMPITNNSCKRVDIIDIILPTDELVWGAFATAENWFYAQSRSKVRDKIERDIKDATSAMNRAIAARDEAYGEIDELSAELADLYGKLNAFKALEVTA